MRGDHRADGSAIGGAIAVTTDILIDRAGVKAGATADTIKAFACFGVGEDICPAVVEQDQDHLIGAVGLAGLTGPSDDGIV